MHTTFPRLYERSTYCSHVSTTELNIARKSPSLLHNTHNATPKLHSSNIPPNISYKAHPPLSNSFLNICNMRTPNISLDPVQPLGNCELRPASQIRTQKLGQTSQSTLVRISLTPRTPISLSLPISLYH